MKVILLQDVKKYGKKGDTINVSDGFGLNYLIPRGMAVASTESSQKTLAKNNAAESARQAELKKEAEALAERLKNINVEFKAKVGSAVGHHHRQAQIHRQISSQRPWIH